MKMFKIPKFKIITDKEYKELKNEGKAYYDMYIDETTQLKSYILDLEYELQRIYDIAADLLNSKKLGKYGKVQQLKEIFKKIDKKKEVNK